MNNDTAIKVEHLSKEYTLRHPVTDEQGGTTSALWALADISFELAKGKTLGIIGPNGSGKSTLLKILAGVTKPTSGSVTVRGKVASILDIGAGFHTELSGRENVFLNGQLLGFSKKAIQSSYAEIVAFSGIGKFIEEPVKNYSSGMYLRLAFSIMVHLDFDIYLLDEVMSVGDAAFKAKCQAKMNEFRTAKQKKTVVMVSHNIWELGDADQVFYMAGGRLDTFSSKEEAARKYYSHTEEFRLMVDNPFYIDKSKFAGGQDCVARYDLFLTDAKGERKQTFSSDEAIRVVIRLEGIRKLFHTGIALKDRSNNPVLELSPAMNGIELIGGETCQELSVSFPARYFNAHVFSIDLLFFNDREVVFFSEHLARFTVLMEDRFTGTMYEKTWGVVRPFLDWEVRPFVPKANSLT